MPQRSHGYAVGRVRVLERDLLSRAALDRLVATASTGELCRALTELGWGEPKTKSDIDALCARRVEDAAELIRHDSPQPHVTDCLLIRYDTLNLKLLLKSRVLGLEAAPLSCCGTLDPERLRRAVAEHQYRDLPQPLADAMEEIEKRIAVAMDPLLVDAMLDKAMYAMIAENLRGVKDPIVRRHFETKADFTNILIALRANGMGRGAGFARELMVSGGALDLDALAQAADDPGRAERACGGTDYLPMIREAVREGGSIARLEKRMDDHLIGLIRPRRFEIGSVLPLMGYLLAREREAAAVRLVAIAKQYNVPGARLNERLRELYV